MGCGGDSELGVKDKQCRKIAGNLWAGNYSRNLVRNLIKGISRDTKWNPDEDIQHFQTTQIQVGIVTLKNCAKLVLGDKQTESPLKMSRKK